MDAQSQAEQGRERLGLGEGPLEGEPLDPILQHVGEVALGQPQAGIQGHPLDLLALAGAVGGAGDGQVAEDRDVAAVVRVGELAAGLAVGGRGGVAHVAVAVGSDVGGE